ncbi:MAG: hypothetical protein QOH93_3018 [Chloroflexia bacterium]|nr:hypothetical protein [Chloroflexia bacterium]
MLDGICPKCGSAEIYTDVHVEGRFSTPSMNLVMAKGGILAPALVGHDNYLCGAYGYLESYVTEPQDVQVLVENWTRLEAR